MSNERGLSQRNLLGIRGLSKQDIDLIHATATEFKDVLNRPIKKVPSLRDFTVANLFFENSQGPSCRSSWRKSACRPTW